MTVSEPEKPEKPDESEKPDDDNDDNQDGNNQGNEGTAYTKISISGDKEVSVGKTITLSAQTEPKGGKVKWESDDENIARVDGKGVVTGVAEGTVRIRAICENTEGIVSIANDNCPGQIVITGEEDAVQAAAAKLQEAGAKRCVPLKVSGPFHSSLLAGAGEKLAAQLAAVTVQDPAIPYLCNVEAAPVTDSSRVKELLAKQVSGTVRWRETVEHMLADGVDTFIEIGPGKTLTGFLRKINRDAKAYNVEKVEDLEKLEQLFYAADHRNLQ